MKALSPLQLAMLVALGAGFWFIFVLFIRWLPFLFDGAWINGALLLAAFPLIMPAIWLGYVLVGLDRHTIFEGIVIGTVTALFLDGLAMTFAGEWYGAGELHQRRGAGFILWGAAAGMLVAWLSYTPKTAADDREQQP